MSPRQLTSHRGFTLIELMIVVAVIGILAAIGLPQYRNYVQRSANSACLSEAKAYIHYAMALAASDITPPDFSPGACESGSNMSLPDYRSNATLTYVPRLRGNPAVLTNAICNAGTGSCRL